MDTLQEINHTIIDNKDRWAQLVNSGERTTFYKK